MQDTERETESHGNEADGGAEGTYLLQQAVDTANWGGWCVQMLVTTCKL